MSYTFKPGYRTGGHKQHELYNHLGNVLAEVSDRIRMKTESTWTQVLSRTDYYPFGLEMTGRTESATYLYGFNGKEKDPSGHWSNQSHYDYGFRIYNSTIGKFLSVCWIIGYLFVIYYLGFFQFEIYFNVLLETMYKFLVFSKTIVDNIIESNTNLYNLFRIGEFS